MVCISNANKDGDNAYLAEITYYLFFFVLVSIQRACSLIVFVFWGMNKLIDTYLLHSNLIIDVVLPHWVLYLYLQTQYLRKCRIEYELLILSLAA